MNDIPVDARLCKLTTMSHSPSNFMGNQSIHQPTAKISKNGKNLLFFFWEGAFNLYHTYVFFLMMNNCLKFRQILKTLNHRREILKWWILEFNWRVKMEKGILRILITCLLYASPEYYLKNFLWAMLSHDTTIFVSLYDEN